MEKKDEIRQKMLDQRLSLEEKSMRDLSLQAQNRLLKSEYWPKKGRVGLYAPVKNEVLTYTLFQHALEDALHVYYPRVEQGLKFYEVNGPEDLQPGSWRIPEPKQHCYELGPEQNLDLLIVPAIVFSKSKHRIGYGKGFYDQLIEQFRSIETLKIVGLGYDFQMVDDVPLDEWDEQLHAVVTDKALYE